MTCRTGSRIALSAMVAGCWSLSPLAANPSDSGLSALARVLQRGRWTGSDVAYVQRLLQRGESIHTQTPRGVTVLMFAAKAGDVRLMRAVLKGGVDVNARTEEGRTALMYAVSSRDPHKVRLLLDAGAEVNIADTRYGRTPLMDATHFKFRDGIKLLLARGAEINARNKNGRTVLAYTDGHPGITRLLRQNGARE